MAARNGDGASTADRELVMTRTFDAPRDLVWKAWTDPTAILQWFGPRGFRNTNIERSVKPGGAWRYIMHGPDGTDWPNRIVYSEVVKPERLVYLHDSDQDDDPAAFHVTVTFAEQAGKTLLTMRILFPSAAALETVKKFGAVEGGQQTLARLDEYLTTNSGQAFVTTRTFDAPRELVFGAFAKAEHLAQWWGPKGTTVIVSTLEFRPGGIFHYCMKSPKAPDMWAKFTYRDIVTPERIVLVNSFSDKDGNITRAPFPGLVWPLEVLTTTTFVEQNGSTVLTLTAVPINATDEERKSFEGLTASMHQGYGGTWDQLTAFLAKSR